MNSITPLAPRALRGALATAALALSLAVPAAAQPVSGPWGITLVSVDPGEFPAGLDAAMLGPPTGTGLYEGSTDVFTLGVGGSVEIELGIPVRNGAGTDLLICENPFFVIGSTLSYAEAVFVEVSSDAVSYARFPTRFTGPGGPYSPFVGVEPAWYRGFAGIMPVHANPLTGSDPFDMVAAGGDAFDLEDLADHPLVLSGDVLLNDIRFVRLVDAQAGTATDSSGTVIWDAGPVASASADIDAVVAVHNHLNWDAGRPQVEMSLVNGFLTISVSDENGLSDIKSGLKATLNGLPVPFAALLPFFVITQIDANSFTLFTGPIPDGMFPMVLKVGARDLSGLAGGDAVVVQ